MSILLTTPDYQVILRAAANDVDPRLWREGFPKELEGAWWYDTLENSRLEDQFQFLYFEVQARDGEPLAVAPAFTMDVPLHLFVPDALVPIIRPLGKIWPALLHQRTLFIGSPCSDEGHVGFRKNVSRAQQSVIFGVLKKAMGAHADTLKAPMRVFKDFRDIGWAEGPLWRDFFVVESFPGSEIDLPSPGTFEDYMMSVKGSRRQKLRRTLRRAVDTLPVTTRIEKHPTPETLAHLYALFSNTREASDVQFEQLGFPFFENIAKHPHVEFVLLETEARQIVAFMMLFTEDVDIWINKFIGIDYAQAKEGFLYFQLWRATVEYALSKGVRRIQSGQTGYDAKISIGHRFYALKNICQHRNPLLHWVYKTVGGQLRWADLDPALRRWNDPS